MLHEIRAMPMEDFLLWSVYYARIAQKRELEALKTR
jgi:hypothetical protein